MRGKGPGTLPGMVVIGITPAYAGKSPASGPVWRKRGDHPRVCGEKAPSAALFARLAGSPPRMRGKVQKVRILAHEERITPAYAGKSA